MPTAIARVVEDTTTGHFGTVTLSLRLCMEGGGSFELEPIVVPFGVFDALAGGRPVVGDRYQIVMEPVEADPPSDDDSVPGGEG